MRKILNTQLPRQCFPSIIVYECKCCAHLCIAALLLDGQSTLLGMARQGWFVLWVGRVLSEEQISWLFYSPILSQIDGRQKLYFSHSPLVGEVVWIWVILGLTYLLLPLVAAVEWALFNGEICVVEVGVIEVCMSQIIKWIFDPASSFLYIT